MKEHRFIVGVSGASGAIYARQFIRELACFPGQSDLIVTDAALRVFNEEFQQSVSSVQEYLEELLKDLAPIHQFKIQDNANIGARSASGSARFDAMVIAPCSQKTLAAIRHGVSATLLERSADVSIKERRPLLLMPRETPLSSIHLENMLALARMGVHIVPASPGFYQKPESLEDLARFMTGRLFNLLGLEHRLFQAWEGK